MNIKEKLDLLGIKEITTSRQKKNGTRIFQLPIKKYGSKIQVGSFKSGYVRRMNGCYTPYQLNKTEGYDHFYPEREWCDERTKSYKTGKYYKHVCRKRILIPNEKNTNMREIIIMIPVLIVVGGLGVTIGIYISSQIKRSIRKNIMNNNIKEYEKSQDRYDK